MAKIKLTKILKEGLEEQQKQKVIDAKLEYHHQRFNKKLEIFKQRLRKDGYNI